MGKLTAYATFQQMKELWRGRSSDQFANSKNKKEGEFAKIFRILGKLYLEKYHIPYAYKLQKDQKIIEETSQKGYQKNI